jgi:hypothetical protein
MRPWAPEASSLGGRRHGHCYCGHGSSINRTCSTTRR